MQCTNNMKQIGLAMHQYHSAYESFPPAGSVDINGNSGGSGRVPQTASIHLRLTNYLEQRAVYDAYNFALGDVLNGGSVPANTTVMATAIPGYLCPSDPNPGSTDEPRRGFHRPGHDGQLRGQRRGQPPEHSAGAPAGRPGGSAAIPYFGGLVRIAAVTDGTSNTAGFSEWVKGKSGQNAPGPNLVYAIAQYTNGGPLNDLDRLPRRHRTALGLQGRILDPPGHRPGRPVLPRHDAEPARLRGQRGLRQRRFVHRRQLVPPRRRERPDPGRLGPVRQVERRADDLECPGHPGLRRGRQRRCAVERRRIPMEIGGRSLVSLPISRRAAMLPKSVSPRFVGFALLLVMGLLLIPLVPLELVLIQRLGLDRSAGFVCIPICMVASGFLVPRILSLSRNPRCAAGP